MKVLHTGDTHFGESRFMEAIKCADFIIEEAKKEKPDLIVHTGDLFDKNVLIDSPVFNYSVNFIRVLSNIAPVMIIRGNHDPSRALDIFTSIKTDNWIAMETGVGSNFMTIKGKIVKVLKIPYVNPRLMHEGVTINDIHVKMQDYIYDQINLLKKEKNTDYKIIIGHISVQGASLSNSEKILEGEVILSVEELDHPEINAVMLGHIHNNKQEIFDGKNIRYNGCPYRKTFGEQGTPGFMIWDIKDKRTTVKTVNTPAREMIQYSMNEEQSREYIKNGELPFEINHNADVKITAEVPEGMASLFDKKALEAGHSEGADIKIGVTTKPKINVRSRDVTKKDGLKEKVGEYFRVSKIEYSKSIKEKVDRVEHRAEV